MGKNPLLLSSFTPDLIEAGCDEVGRGCLAGPVVAAAVILPKNYSHEVLNDSKQLTREERDQLQCHFISALRRQLTQLTLDQTRGPSHQAAYPWSWNGLPSATV